MTFVLDASIAISWHLSDEESPFADAMLERLRNEAAVVPAIWPLEVANGLLVAERRGRLSFAERTQAVEQTINLPITVRELTEEYALQVVLDLASEQRLTAYDAAYLDLAMKEGLPLATQDDDLVKAARRVGVELLSQ